MTILLAEIFGAGADRAVLLDQRRHDIVDRFEALGIPRRIPSEQAENVVSASRRIFLARHLLLFSGNPFH